MVTVQGRRKRLSGWGASEEEAEADLRSKTSDSSKEETVWTLQRFADERYMPTVRNLSEKWQGQIAWALDGHIYPAFGSDLLRNVDRHRIQLALNAKLRVLSRASVGHLRKVLFAILSLAEADGLLSSNPVKHVKLPTPVPSETPRYTILQLSKLFGACKETALGDFVFLAGFCGLRYSEALNVRWKPSDRHLSVETSKTAAGVRLVPLTPSMRAYLQSRTVRGVFKIQQKFHTHRNLRRELYPLQEKLKLPHVTPHGLRHSFATGLRALGCPEDDRRDLLGHAGGMTRRYSAADLEKLGKWVGKLYEKVDGGRGVQVQNDH